ncbi:NAD(P)-dependent oxidoreductase [Pseudooceanicola sp.]|uniref:NAD(P)-dependent oxidoreductase n=1 Tax=Pseudooceanicola sp. TaxID=1914328 RepID=UPI00262A1B63|nr:NAD(P)-dependent oxidoreductase [Pseudooceanicola sp.]MDF1856184.1 NAD(P)-dependent oxidoreductase [Pseudooceanicola sp.]
MTVLGFIGIGTMGAPMVHCLAMAGQRPLLQDASIAAAQVAADRDGLSAATTAVEVGATCDLVILMLPDSAIVRDVCLGAGGLAAAMAPGGVIVDMSSSDPIETRKLGAELAARGLILLDAPVSGGLRKARDGSLAIMLGGDDAAAMDRAEPILTSMGKVFRAGPLAAGHATKALNNYVSAAGLVAACEAVIVGRDFGLDPAVLTQIVNASTGRNNSTENKIAQFVLSGAFRDAGFSLRLMTKDVGLAAGLGQHTGHDLPGLEALAKIWRDAADVLEPAADHTEIFHFLESIDGANAPETSQG